MARNHPLLYQINTRILLQELGSGVGRHATLDDVPDSYLDGIAHRGFDYVWLLGVWQTGEASRQVSLTRPELQEAYKVELPDWRPEDVSGSPYAVQAYTTHRDFGGDEALARLRQRLRDRGLDLVLDFVVNHSALDHAWVQTHPEYYIPGTEDDLAREPQNFVRLATKDGSRILAYGRDPYFAGWPDALQLNLRDPRCREAQIRELLQISTKCDGVRCDMAMLVQPHVFQKTWGDRSLPKDGTPPAEGLFWEEAVMRVRDRSPDFLFMAEVYWGLEWALQQQGFNYTYDKALYDRLHAGAARPVREHLMADYQYQVHSARFLENHDEPRAAEAFSPEMHRAAAMIAFFVPGLRFFHEGEFDGRRVHTSMHLNRRPAEPVDASIRQFYDGVLKSLQRPETHDGQWRLWSPRPAWDGNDTWDQFIVFTWEGRNGQRLLGAVNYGPNQGQCYVTLDIPDLAGRDYRLQDVTGDTVYQRSGDGLTGSGLYLDMPPWGHNLFDMVEEKAVSRAAA